MKKSILLVTLMLVFGCPYASAQTERGNRQSSNLPNLIGTIWETEQLSNPKTNGLINYFYFFKDKDNVRRQTFRSDPSPSAPYAPRDPYNPTVLVPVPTFPISTPPKNELGTYKIVGNTIYLTFSGETLSAKIIDGVMLLEVESGGVGLKSYKANYHTMPLADNKSPNQQSKKPTLWAIDDKYMNEYGRLFNAGNFAGMIEISTKEINLEPNNPINWILRAEVYSMSLRQYREAINDYDQAIRICSQWELEVEAYKKSGRTMSENEEFYWIFLSPLDSCHHSYHSRGVAKKMLGDEVGASEDFRRACDVGVKEDCKLFEIPANSPLLGTWTYVEYFDLPSYVPQEAREALKRVKTSMTAVFSKDGTLEITTHSFMDLAERTSWNYVPQGETAGTLEQYKGSEMLSKSNVKWVNANQLEYTVTYHKDSKLIGTKITWTRSASIHFR